MEEDFCSGTSAMCLGVFLIDRLASARDLLFLIDRLASARDLLFLLDHLTPVRGLLWCVWRASGSWGTHAYWCRLGVEDYAWK